MAVFSRRDLGRILFCATCGHVVAQDSAPGSLSGMEFQESRTLTPREARFWEKLPGKKVRCKLCPQECTVALQERGTCGVRENRDGTYYTLVHSQVCAAHVDPIEKKPLFHYKPGTQAFSIATPGCNIECQYCQNWQISQFRPEQVPCQYVPPGPLVAYARKMATPTIAFTYSEPVIFYEYMADVADEARREGIGSVMISNGFIQQDPIKQLLPKLSAVKIDFKGFSEDFYRDVCRGKLKPVLDTLVTVAESGTWLELVMLVVPSLNDDAAQNRDMFRWIRLNLGDSVPLHLTRFHPMYKLKNLPSTPVATLERLYNDARNAGLKFVYLGNVYGHPAEQTYCPGCHKILIRRVGFEIIENSIRNGCCDKCGTRIPGVFS